MRSRWPPFPRARTGILALALAGCGLLGPDEELRPGVIVSYGQPLLLEAPDTVDSGVPFRASVRTYGGGCISKGPTTVSVEGRTATIVPLDRHRKARYCTDDLAGFTHETEVVFQGAGPAFVAVRGRVEPGDSLVVRQRTVHVR